MQETIQKSGDSQGIRIPKVFPEAIGMPGNDPAELNRADDNIVIPKVKDNLTLEDIFKGYDEKYAAGNFDWGDPAGKEVW